MKIEVDVDQLRESLLDRAGSAAGVGFPAAMLDVMDIEDESPQELLARAEREGLDLRDFAVDDDKERLPSLLLTNICLYFILKLEHTSNFMV